MIRTPGFITLICVILCFLNYIMQASSACMDYQPMEDFDVDKLKDGVWWTYQIFNPNKQIEPQECLNTKFYVNKGSEEDNKVRLTVIEDFISKRYDTDVANHVRREYIVKQEGTNKGAFTGNFPSGIGFDTEVNYQILHTNYDKWMIVFIEKCSEKKETAKEEAKPELTGVQKEGGNAPPKPTPKQNGGWDGNTPPTSTPKPNEAKDGDTSPTSTPKHNEGKDGNKNPKVTPKKTEAMAKPTQKKGNNNIPREPKENNNKPRGPVVSYGMVLTKEKELSNDLKHEIEELLRGNTLKNKNGENVKKPFRAWYSIAENKKCTAAEFPASL